MNLVAQPARGRIAFPPKTPSAEGQYGGLRQQISVRPTDSHHLSVRVRDDFGGATAGYHVVQVLIDDTIVAEQDVAGGDGWREVTADVTQALAGKTSAVVTLRLFEKRGVTNFGVVVLFDDISISGTTIENADFEDPHATAWEPVSNATKFTVSTRSTGSYAGPDVEHPPADALPRPGASGFDWLVNTERDTAPAASFSLDWSVVDSYDVHESDPDVHLRLHALHEADDVALCDGIPPRNKPGNPASLKYLVSHRHGADLASQFVSVIEPYRSQPFIRSVTRVDVRPVSGSLPPHEATAVKVELANGRVDYVVSATRPEVQLRIDGQFLFRGSFGVYTMRDGTPEYAFGHDTSTIGPLTGTAGPSALTGTLRDFTSDLSSQNQLTIELSEEGPRPDVLIGAYVYVDNDGQRNAVYPIRDATAIGDTNTTLVLDIGDLTTVRGFVDPDDFEQGYRHDIVRGAAIRIPLTREWHRHK
ncbi:MAG: hypothetical protein ACRDP8_05445 [Actinopolymorphaceae bacterium]